MAALGDGTTEAYEPVVDDEEAVSYPAAEQVLDPADGVPRDVLESLAEREILHRTFEGKAYRCPECGLEGMRYTTACPECASAHVVRRPVVRCPDCDHAAPATAFERGGETASCPACDATTTADDADPTEQYVCQECGERAESAVHALRCRDDGFLCHPDDAVEHVLYRYTLGASGEQWLDAQVGARRAVAETFADRGYDVEVDTTVTGASGSDHHLHVHASDDLLGERLVADVHELPTVGDVTHLREASTDLDARPLLVSTLGTVSEAVADRATRDDVTVLTVDEKGEIDRDYDVTEAPGEDRSFLARLTTALR
ncbi:hypothetical protein [Halomarina litorea]|uniref:TackOD1 domain-containing metal-binding protein n=1 Tax=Halomarina litorea TaxID=2961595 RepID=UPI0020C1D258|nr:hypothetical protein [Halomarina sp. BCD28]